MNAIRLTALLVYAFGAYAYGTVLFLSLRAAWRPHADAPDSTEAWDGSLLTMMVVSTAWFIVNLVLLLTDMIPGARDAWLRLALLWLALLFPPLIVHMALNDRARRHADRISTVARVALIGMYAAHLGLASWLTLAFAGAVEVESRTAGRIASAGMSAGFIAAALIAIALADRRPRPADRARSIGRSEIVLYWLMVAIFLLLFAAAEMNSFGAAFEALMALVARSLPLTFMFVITYSENRFEFFDLFVKRGLSMLVALVVLAGSLALGQQWLGSTSAGAATVWIYAFALLPVVLALPWVQAQLTTFLDRRWLGRHFTAGDAVKEFITFVRPASTEADLTARAARSLSAIFAAPALVLIGDTRPPDDFEIVQTTDVPRLSGDSARFVLGRRMSEAPYFSEDVALLASLADVFASFHETVTMQQQQIEQERRTRELQLHASRSEVKALRAQINPHFLFNALNAIAGLTHRDPAAADRTIEQLADVFRYTLRGSLNEWVLVDEELEIVRAYLDIERTRFGARFSYSVRMEPAASGAYVPAMMIQTLVENAVKHGVAGVLHNAMVDVTARALDGRLIVAVFDNGPGFLETGRSTPADATTGFGLLNIRRRLDGHFGADASISINRERDPDRTSVAITLPLLHQDPGSQALHSPAQLP